MDVGATVVAHQLSAELTQPREAALRDQALGAEAGTVLAAPSGDEWREAACQQPSAATVVVVAAVGERARQALELVVGKRVIG